MGTYDHTKHLLMKYLHMEEGSALYLAASTVAGNMNNLLKYYRLYANYYNSPIRFIKD